MHQILRFSGSSNRYDPRIFGTRLNGAFVSSNIVALRYARQRPAFVFASAGVTGQESSRARSSPIWRMTNHGKISSPRDQS